MKKERKSDFQELFKSLIYFEIIILTGIGTLTYKILAKEVEFIWFCLYL